MNTDISKFDFEGFSIDAIKNILQHEDPKCFLQWAQTHIMQYFPAIPTAQDQATPDMLKSLAYTMASAIWNCTPLPGKQFKTQPLEKPQRNQICPCESVRKYKHCCNGAPSLPPFPEEMIWLNVISLIDYDKYEKQIRQRIPLRVLLISS